MKKYYCIQWPESKAFMKNKECIQGQGMTFFVPCEIYEKVKQETAG